MFLYEGEFGRGDLRRCVCTMLVCICVEFAVICCCVTVFGCVSMLVV